MKLEWVSRGTRDLPLTAQYLGFLHQIKRLDNRPHFSPPFLLFLPSLPLFFLNRRIILYVYKYLYVYHVGAWYPRVARRGHWLPCNWNYDCGCWEQNLYPLQEQQMLLTTEPSLQPFTSSLSEAVSCSSGWPQTYYMDEGGLEVSAFLPLYLPIAGITRLCSTQFSSVFLVSKNTEHL